jgi:hypothetical protein
MQWFSRGQLWDRRGGARRRSSRRRSERREPRPRLAAGGEHRDPRQKFIDAKKARNLDGASSASNATQDGDEGTAATVPDRPIGPSDRRPPRAEGAAMEGRPTGPKPEGRA